MLSRGNNKQCIFTDNVDYEKYQHLLSGALERFGLECHGFCLLWNHAHLLMTAGDFPIGGAMRQLNSHYCQWFNHRHSRVGHVLQGRYRYKLIEEGSYFLNAVRYVALNPVVGQKVAAPADWPWSSYRAAVGLEPATVPLSLRRIWKDLDAKNESEGRERLKLFVESGGHPDELWGPLIRGSQGFMRTLDPLLERHRGKCDFTYADRFATRPPLASLISGDGGREAKEDRVRIAFLQHAYTLREIGENLQLHPSTVWRWVERSHSRRK